MKQFSNLAILCLLILAMGLTACSENTASAKEVGDPVVGQTLFSATCAACHGPSGQGLTGIGKNLVTSEFVAAQSDHELIEFIRVGRSNKDPLNTTGVTMPARGGNAALSDKDLYDIVAYIRTIHE